MTGFGAAEGVVGGARVAVEIRSVNHRFFTPSIKLPGAFARWEAEVREALRKRIARGHVTLFARIEDSAERAGAVIDETRFAAYVAQLRLLQARHGLSGIDASTILRLPDVLSTEREEASGTVDELLVIVEQAAADHTGMRTAEGERLAAYLEERVAEIEHALGRIEVRAPQRLVDQRDRMRANVLELTQGVGVDEQRIA
ncbi:MAG: hypothetical protein H0X64_07570, partial [Gemmatimonadaceae bacterium]|nr:hypothetical protein [Gemmatimonadaceae bacterium]